jgi:dihydromonapterin reductase/dihydrofolate reductase
MALAPLLLRCNAPHADIIHITDIFADNPNYVFDGYCASKAAAQNLALSFAKRLAPKVKVNVIQPGPILFQEWHDPAARAAVLDETLLAAEGGAEAIGLAVEATLANDFQTGAIIAVDGGRRLGQRRQHT